MVCLRQKQYNDILFQQHELPIYSVFNTHGKLVVCLIEFRCMPEIDYITRAMLNTYTNSSDIEFIVVHGNTNSRYVNDLFGKWTNVQ